MSHLLTRLPLILGFGLLLLALPNTSQAQCGNFTEKCETNLGEFNTDGGYYRSMLFEGEQAKLYMTFYEGMTYRIILCGESDKGDDLNFLVLDSRGVGVFNSAEMEPRPYYDFSFNATGDYEIEARFLSGDGCAAIIVGYLENSKAEALAGQ